MDLFFQSVPGERKRRFHFHHFLALIDEFYGCRIKLGVAAERHFSAIYRGECLAFEYQRCLSRLQAMQSRSWLQHCH